MNSISSISSSSASAVSWTRQKPDASTMAANLMKKADADGSGTISQAELEKSLTETSGRKDSSSATALMKGLDSDSDGSISKQELTDGLQKLSDQFDAQFNASRTSHADGPPPPHGGHGGPSPADGSEKTGSTSATCSDSSTTSSATAYDPADVNQDGSVSAEERLAYQAKEADKDGGVDAAAGKQHGISHILEQLAQMYGSASAGEGSTGTISISA
jgi:hypothetical protein